jgi:hypothetical protein
VSADPHLSCDRYQEQVLEGIALHFGSLAPLVRTVAWHVMNDHGGEPTECGLDFKYADLPTPQDTIRSGRGGWQDTLSTDCRGRGDTQEYPT